MNRSTRSIHMIGRRTARTCGLLFFAVSAATAAAQTTWYVDVNNMSCSDSGPGTEGEPFCHIQAAIASPSVSGGDTVEVRPGTYNEAIDFLGKAITLRSSGGRDVTTIDASGLGAPVVTCATGEGPDTILDGFTITGGSAGYGGGMRNEGSSPTVTNCTFTGNTATAAGGGMHNDDSSPTVTNCTFSGNTASASGGGMRNYTSSPTVTNCTFTGNTTTRYGGGLQNYISSPTVTNCTFSGNRAGWGAGMHNWNTSSPAVTNCTFTGNSAEEYGGGMHNDDSSPMVTNCILWGDTAPNGPEISNTNSTPTVTYSDVQGSYTGAGNIDDDPFFVDADGPDDTFGTEDDNLRLQGGSPCIDAGDNSAVSETTDRDGNPRILDGDGDGPATADMGAYEYFAADCNDNGIPDMCDLDCSALDGECNVEGCGLSSDGDGDGYPDECDTVHNVTQGTWHPSIQLAIDSALNDDEIVAGPRTYRETIDFLGKAITLRSADPSDPAIVAATIIDGTGRNNSVVKCISGEGLDTVLEGFTITGGSAGYGGGMRNEGSSPTVTNCTFTGNTAGKGGGMCNRSGSAPTITNCTFSGNSAPSGGGMYNWTSNPTVTNCAFNGNSADYGGGMRNWQSSPTVDKCTFAGNTASNDGGGLNNYWHSGPRVTNCAFSGNSADPTDGSGGGMFTNGRCNPTVTNCTFTGNSAANGQGIACDSLDQQYPSSVSMTNCILWDGGNEIWNNDGSTITVTYSDVQGGTGQPWLGPGCIDEDPLFLSPGGGDLRLQTGSPCIDAGDNTAVSEATDLDGNIRIVDGDGDATPTVDMGAYEYLPDCNENGIPDMCDLDCSALGGSCDIPGCGSGEDCNANNVPDECDLLPEPAEDDCVDAQPVGPNVTYTGTTVGATNDGIASCGESSTSADVWYSYTPDADGAVTAIVSLAGSEYDTVLSIHTGCPVNSTNEEVCNDDYEGLHLQSQVTFPVTRGTQYLIRIAGYLGDTGLFTMTVTGPQAEGTSGDCNANNVPDECELLDNDCNGNGVPDECEIPQVCGGVCTEYCDPDCNCNGVPDACDPDCQPNDIPDECEIPEACGGSCTEDCDPDCNCNAVPDGCDMADGTSQDCQNNGQGNGIPDECEIDQTSPAPGGPFYCTDNCDPDCNDTGIPDECDIASGTSQNCNTNVFPDECEIDFDQDGYIDDCDNCPYTDNPDQLDVEEPFGVGDACQEAVYLGEELTPPDDIEFPVDPAATEPYAPELEGECQTRAEAVYDACILGGGSEQDCQNRKQSFFEQCFPNVFFHDVEGRWFAKDAGQVTLTWRELNGEREYPYVYVIAGGANPDPDDPDSAHVNAVEYYPNYSPAANVRFATNLDFSVLWNSSLYSDCDTDGTEDILHNDQTDEIEFDEDCINEDNSDEPRAVLLQYDGSGGNLIGFEVLTIVNATVVRTEVPIGRRLVKPGAADESRAILLANGNEETYPGDPIAWQRAMETTDIYPIRRLYADEGYDDFCVAWYEQSGIACFDCDPPGPRSLGKWPAGITEHRTRWPGHADEPAQIHVVDGQTPLALVDLQVGQGGLYSSAEIMNQQPIVSGDDPPGAVIDQGYFSAIRPGWTVLKFEGPTAQDVTFEVVRSYLHDNDYDPPPDDGGPGYIRAETPVPVPVGQLVDAPPLHAADTPGWPNGFIYDGHDAEPLAPFAPCIYGLPCADAGDCPGSGGLCVDGICDYACGGVQDTRQIIPVNESNLGGSPDHGLVEVWYFMPSRDTADGNFAGGILWPRFVHTYEAFWPDHPYLPEPVELPEIVIASGLGTGPDGIGCGDYGEHATIYSMGLRDDDVATQENTIGWNANDEHAQLVEVLAGSDWRVYAQRNDAGWGAVTGFPYVLVQLWDDIEETWSMDVLKVVAQDETFTFRYDDRASVEECVVQWDPVVAGVGPLNPPLFPINYGMPDNACATGLFEVYVDPDDPPDAWRAVWEDRTGAIWPIAEQIPGVDPTGIVLTTEYWEDEAEPCNPWLSDGTEDPTPLVFYPTWPEVCGDPPIQPCAGNYHVGQTVDQSAACSLDIIWDETVGVRIMDPTLEVGVTFADLLPDFDLAAPHLAAGKSGDLLQEDRIWYDNVAYELKFRGIMNDQDFKFLSTGLLGDPVPAEYSAYVDALGQLRTASHEQLDPGFDPGTLAAPHVTLADPAVQVGYATIALNNGDCAEPVDVQVWHAACPPYTPPVKVYTTACPFGEAVVLQVDLDFGGYPEQLAFQWQQRFVGEDWSDWPIPAGESEMGRREVLLAGADALVDRQVRVRYRGYSGCACASEAECLPDGETAAWPSSWGSYNSGTQISEWSEVVNVQGWLKRLTNGLNAFDSRVHDFHSPEGLNYTYLDMIEQAGPPYDGTAILSCDPDNLQEIGLIEAYQTAADRVKGFTIFQRPATTAEALAISFITARIADLYLLLANEASSDASDPMIGTDPQWMGGYSDMASSMYAFEGMYGAASLAEEELALLRGTDLNEGPPWYNRLRWNMGLEPRGKAAYVSTYNITDKDGDGFFTSGDAGIMFPQGHGDAWGHYLSGMKTYYQLLRDNNFEWIISTEFLDTTPVTYQYERRFAEAAAAKARTGAEIVERTFRERYDAEPTTDPGFPDDDADRAWGVSEWAQRAGQGAYFDWVLANALLDDDDSEHEGIERVDRPTMPELQEIAAAYAQIQGTVDNAGNGLNPLGLATNVVPFGISSDLLAQGVSHYEQVRCWALEELQNTDVLFDYANDDIRRLRRNEDSMEDFAANAGAQNQDFNARLIEIFGRPYDEDIQGQECLGCPPGAYPAGYTGPDIFHFDYFDYTYPSQLLDDTDLVSDAYATTYASTFTDYTGLINGDPSTPATYEVPVNVSTVGLGLVKPEGYSTRPEPGEVQLARSEFVQTIIALEQAISAYEAHLAQIEAEIGTWESLTQLNSDILYYMTSYSTQEKSLNNRILASNVTAAGLRVAAEKVVAIGEAIAEFFPTSVGFSVDVTAPARGAAKMAGVLAESLLLAGAVTAEGYELGYQHDLQEAAMQADINITHVEQDFAEENQIAVIEQLIRETPVIRLDIYQQIEAVNQAAGRYQQAIGRGVRLLDQRTAFRKRTAGTLTDYRYKDFAFRILRNESLQKYRAMFDLAARYVYLAAKAYDYDTNMPTNARDYLQSILKQRVLGAVPSQMNCEQGFANVSSANTLAGQLWGLDLNFENVDRNRFQSAHTRIFSLREQLFRVSETDEATWRAVLSQSIRPNLQDVEQYVLYASPINPRYDGPALVIPFSTTVTSGLNFFGWQINGPNYPSDAYAVKFQELQIRMRGLPPGLIPTVNVYLLPVGCDVMRVPGEGDPRMWNLIDQTLPMPTTLGDYENDYWMPWDTWIAGPEDAVKRRLQPSVAACDCDSTLPPNECPPCDISTSLVARSVWNTNWVLIIPGVSLSNVDPWEGIDIFINGVKDVEIVIDAITYNLSSSDKSEGGEPDNGSEPDQWEDQP